MLIKDDKSMKKVRAAIVGYGNIGHYVLQALQAAPDFEVAGVVRRAGAENRPAELNDYPVVKDIEELKDVDVAILCTPTRKVEEHARKILAMGIHTVDSLTRAATPWCAPCWRPSRRRASPTPTSARA